MKNSDKRPLFVVSSPRSGSTLLRLILDTHPNIGIPPPGHLFHLIFPYLYSYGNLESKDNIKALIEDILATPTIKKWSIKLSVKQVLENIKEYSYRGVYEYIHMEYAKLNGKVRWGEKTPRNGFWIDEIKELFPGAQFIHLLRDGRDTAIDIADAKFWPHSLYGGARRWQESVRIVRYSAKNLSSDSFLEIRYEDLCKEPEYILRQVCNFLREDFVPELLNHYSTNSTQYWAKNPIHAATARPITTDYVGMYKKRLHNYDIAAIEAVIGDTLRDVGYKVEGGPIPIPYRTEAQLMEGDMVSMLEKVKYKGWHRERRRERREKGAWKDSDRKSYLWGLD